MRSAIRSWFGQGIAGFGPVLSTTAFLLLAACDPGTGPGVAKVAAVEISAASSSVAVDRTLQLTATAKDAAGNVLSGRSFVWTSSDTTLAAVDASGLVTARAAGAVEIMAAAEGQSGKMALKLFVPGAARVTIDPQFLRVDLGQGVTLKAAATDSSGAVIRTADIRWSSLASGVASVSAVGGVTGVSAGEARVVAQVDQASDTAVVAVLGTRSLLATAFVGGTPRASVKPGQQISVPVALDLAKVSSSGDLGSAEFELRYPAEVLQFDSASAGISGSAQVNLVSPGVVRFAYAGTSPQGKAQLTLATLFFRVAANAAPGTVRTLDLVYTSRPVDTSFASYESPIAIDGSIRVVSP